MDNGAANHMTSMCGVFAELDTNIHNTVCFGDGSVVEIEGIGTVLFACKDGEHISLTGVYLIPMLTMNIVSFCQLDEIGYEVMICRGVIRLWDEQKRLLVKVQCSSN
jgi:hypothetical protein